MTGGCNNLVVFSDDWARHPSSCQHLVSHLLHDCDVTWVNTIGTRPPRLDAATLHRGLEKLRHWKGRKAADRPSRVPSPRVLNPMMWPSFAAGWSRAVNCRLLERHLRRRVAKLDDSTILTTIPVVADLVERVPDARWVYYCVDDFSKWPGLDGRTLQKMEEVLIARVDAIVAAGPNLAANIQRRGRRPLVLTHGVDLDFWEAFPAASHPTCFDEYERPLILFWGLIDRRLDVAWLEALAEQMTEGTILLVGPEQDPAPELDHVPRVVRTGPMPFEALPTAAAAADVLIMPYADLPVTRAMQPLKLKEYLATGKPVVVRRLPATTEWGDCLFAADREEEFVAHVQTCLQEGVPREQQLARQQLAGESWAAKAELLRRVISPAAELVEAGA